MNVVYFFEFKIFLVLFIDEGFGFLFYSLNVVLFNCECYGIEFVEFFFDLLLFFDLCGVGVCFKWMCFFCMDYYYYYEV